MGNCRQEFIIINFFFTIIIVNRLVSKLNHLHGTQSHSLGYLNFDLIFDDWWMHAHNQNLYWVPYTEDPH